MTKELNKASLTKRLELYSGFLKSEIPKIGFFDLTAGFIFNRLLFEVQQYLDETDSFTNYFLLFIIINNVMLWLYHNFLSPFEAIASNYQKEFFIEYPINPQLTQEAAIEKITKLQASEEKNWSLMAIPSSIFYGILLPFNINITGGCQYVFQSIFPMLWSFFYHTNKSLDTFSYSSQNVINISHGLSKAIKGGIINFICEDLLVMQFSLKMKHNLLFLVNGPKLQLCNELTLRIIANVIRRFDSTVLIMMNASKKNLCLEIISMPKFSEKPSKNIIDDMAESLKLHLLAAHNHLAPVNLHLNFLNKAFIQSEIPERWKLYYSEEEQQFIKEKPELILDTKGIDKSMFSSLITVLERYGYQPIQEENYLIRVANWDQVIASKNEIALLINALRPKVEVSLPKHISIYKEEVKSIFPGRTFFQPSENKIKKILTYIKLKSQTNLSKSIEIKGESKFSEEKLIFDFGVFGNSESPSIKRVRTENYNKYIFIFVTEYIKMKMGNFRPLMQIYEDPKLNWGEGPGFKYSQEKISNQNILVKLKGKNIDECPASTQGFYVRQPKGLSAPTFYIFDTWFRHNRTRHSARFNGPGKLPTVDVDFLNELYKNF